MRIIIAPAKKMRVDNDTLAHEGLPMFLEDAERLREELRSMSYTELKALWKCNDRIAAENAEWLEHMDLRSGLTPAILSYDGIAYKYMAPNVFTDGAFTYVQDNLRILSGFYGILKPMDGVVPHRLEMSAKGISFTPQAKLGMDGHKDLYSFWGRRLYSEARDESGVIINLASKEYSKCIEKYLEPSDRFITLVFGELERVNGRERIVQKGVYAKMARGQTVRLMAENGIHDPEQLKELDILGYRFDESRSDIDHFVYLRQSLNIWLR